MLCLAKLLRVSRQRFAGNYLFRISVGRKRGRNKSQVFAKRFLRFDVLVAVAFVEGVCAIADYI